MKMINDRMKELSKESPEFSDCGQFSDDDINDMMKRVTRFYVEICHTPFGIQYRYLKTNKQNPSVFEDFLAAVRSWAYKYLDIDIPTPNAIGIEFYAEN